MSKVTREQQKNEAVSRLKKLGLWNEAIKSFDEEDIILISEPPIGGVYALSDKQNDIVKMVEEKFGGLVYHVILSNTNFGTLETYLFVGDDDEEWEFENEDIKEGIVFAWCENLDAPDCSEAGCVTVMALPSGGLRRVY